MAKSKARILADLLGVNNITEDDSTSPDFGAFDVEGSKGQKGEIGTKGQKGVDGFVGSDGSDGDKGQKGEAGSDGNDGNDGDKGQKGQTGATFVADKGQKGEAGSDGTDGDKGQKGEAGSDGTDGDKGQKGQGGTDGTDGDKGQKGQGGTDGTDGDKGQKGEAGEDGPGGEDGDKGQKGQTGDKGLKGQTGTKGQKGQTGDKGQKGQTGDKGQKGQTGDKGQKGQTGDKGQKGQTGDKGNEGQKGQTGNFGGASFAYDFDTATDLGTALGSGEFRLNQVRTNWASASTMYISDTDQNSKDISDFLNTIDDSTSDIRGHVKISLISDPSEFALFVIDGQLVSGTGVFSVAVDLISSTRTFADGDACRLTFARTGDAGDKGQKGQTGEKGQKGQTGDKGQKGQTGDKGQKGEVGQKGQKGEVGQKGQKGIGEKGQKGDEAGNADTLNGVNSSGYLRSNTNDNVTDGAKITFDANTVLSGDVDSQIKNPSILSEFMVNPASEGGAVQDIRIINDLAGFNKWGTATLTDVYKSDRTTAYANTEISENAFDGVSSHWTLYQNNSNDPNVIELDISNNQLNWSAWVGIVFGNDNWRAKSVKIEVYRGTGWQTECDLTNQPDAIVMRKVANNDANGIQRIRYTLDDYQNTTGNYCRVHSFFAFNYIAGGNSLGGVHYIDKYKDATVRANTTWRDNYRAKFGDNGELNIFNNGTNSVISDEGDGVLSLQTNGSELNIWDSTNSQHMAQFTTGGAVSLRHDGDIKIATESTGINVTGNIEISGSEVISSSGIWTGSPSGLKGDKGLKGQTGDKGETGQKGQKGQTGAKGDQGDKGQKGAQGDKGETGQKGQKGQTGAKGDQGDKGQKGAQGDKGETGQKGQKGVTGQKGDQGDKGQKGEVGDKGETGQKGQKGVTGQKGDQGDKGEVGQKGQKGEVGQKGQKGQTGAKGDQGDKGQKGAQGDKGDTGQKGQKGQTGQKGDQGDKGTTGDKGQKGVGEKGQKGDEAGNAGLLDGLDSTQFLRSDTADNFSGKLTWTGASTGVTSLELNNSDIRGVNVIEINDPGEGIEFRKADHPSDGQSTIVHLRAIDSSPYTIMDFDGATELRVGGTRVLTASDSGGYSLQLNQGATTEDRYYKIAYIPANNGGVYVKGLLGGHETDDAQGSLSLDLAIWSRNGDVNVQGTISGIGGSSYGGRSLFVTKDSSNNISVWVHTNRYALVNLSYSGVSGATLYHQPDKVTTEPTDDKVFTTITHDVAAESTVVLNGSLTYKDSSNNISTFGSNHSTNSAIRHTTEHGYIEFGPINTSYAHIQTDRSKFYFNAELNVNPGKISSHNQDLQLLRFSGNTTPHLTLGHESSTFATPLTVTMPMAATPSANLYLDVSGSNTNGGGGSVIFSTSASSGTTTQYNAQISGIRSTTGDGSSEIVFKTANVAVQTDGIPLERIRINSDGNLGIGTNDPKALLHVKSPGNVGDAGIIIEADADNNYEEDNPYLTLKQDSKLVTADFRLTGDAVEGYGNTNSLLIEAKCAANNATGGSIQLATGGLAEAQTGGPTNGSVRMHIDPSGNIGIGTQSPVQKLQVDGGSIYTNGGEFFVNTGKGISAVGDLVLRTHDGSSYQTTMHLDGADQKVGIGTTNPGEKLSVAPDTDVSAEIGKAHIGNIGHNNHAGFSHVDKNTANDYALLQNEAGKTFLNSSTGQPIAFRINNADQMNLTSTGLGIGNSAPTDSLHVHAGSINVTPVTYTANADDYVLKYGASNNDGWDGMGLKLKADSNGIPYTSFCAASGTSVLNIKQTRVGIGTESPTTALSVHKASSVTPNSSTATLHLDDRSSMAADVGGSIVFTGAYTAADVSLTAGPYIKAYKMNSTADEYGFGLKFAVRENGSTQKVAMTITDDQDVGIGTTTPGHKLEVNGSFAATTKSFDIEHPTKDGYRLRYGSLEGPELGVYVRGRSAGGCVELPEHWTGLVDEETITVNLTAIGSAQDLYVEKIENNKVYINCEGECFYTIFGERKDVDKLEVEYEELNGN